MTPNPVADATAHGKSQTRGADRTQNASLNPTNGPSPPQKPVIRGVRLEVEAIRKRKPSRSNQIQVGSDLGDLVGFRGSQTIR